jgi:hypothetical protein
MKKHILLCIAFAVISTINAQTWKMQIERITGNPKLKTIKMNTKTHIRIQVHSFDNDSTEENTSYEGDFRSGTHDSIEFKLSRLETFRKYNNGVQQRTTFPPKYHLKDTTPEQSIMRIALPDIDQLKYQQKNKVIKGLDNVMKPLIFASLFVMILSPIISYNYKEGELNAERYKYWALGSTMGITLGFAYVALTNSRPVQKQFQFNTEWPDKKAAVWRFK